MRKKLIAALVVVALLAGGGWWGYKYYRTKSASTATQVRYMEGQVQKGNLRSTISGTGPVASVNGVSVKASQTGTVAQILAQDGQQVKAGQVIMILDNPTLRSSLQQAILDLNNARTSLDNLLGPQETSVRGQQLKVQSARLTLQQRERDMQNLTVRAPQGGVVSAVSVTEGSDVTSNSLLLSIYDDSAPTFTVGLSQQVAARVLVGDKVKVDLTGMGSFEGTVQQSGSGATPTSGNRDATVPIAIALPAMPGIRAGMVGMATFNIPDLTYVVQGSGSIKSTLVEVRSKVAATISQLTVKEGVRVKAGDLLVQFTSDTLALQLQQAENDLNTQEQALISLVDPMKDKSDTVLSLQQKIDQAQITLSTRQSDVDDLMVKAPVDGQISQLTPRVGDKITNNQALFRVADYGAMQVTISVDELDVAKVKVGQQATVTLDALPGKTYQGKISKINPEGVFRNDIATFEVTMTIDKPEGLMAGMNSTVNVVVENKQGVLVVPAQAVKTQQGKSVVQQLVDGKPVSKEVQIGLKTSSQVEITGGLNEGDKVIVTTISGNSTQAGGAGFNFPGMGGGMGRDVVPATGGVAPTQGGQRPTGTTPATGGGAGAR